MYDIFQAFQGVEKQNFVFQPVRYEIWKKGIMVGSGRTAKPIISEVSKLGQKVTQNILIAEEDLYDEILDYSVFDEFITGRDRLQLINVPERTNVECMGITALRQIVGPTRPEKNFETNEPYCCNIFLIGGTIAKLAFSFSNPEKLIEFYSSDEPEQIEKSDLQKLAEEIQKLKEKSSAGTRQTI